MESHHDIARVVRVGGGAEIPPRPAIQGLYSNGTKRRVPSGVRLCPSSMPERYQKYAFGSGACPSHPGVPGSRVLRGKSGGTVGSTVVTDDADQPV